MKTKNIELFDVTWDLKTGLKVQSLVQNIGLQTALPSEYFFICTMNEHLFLRRGDTKV